MPTRADILGRVLPSGEQEIEDLTDLEKARIVFSLVGSIRLISLVLVQSALATATDKASCALASRVSLAIVIHI